MSSLYKLCQMKDEKERNYLSLRTMFWKCLLPIDKIRLKSTPQKLNLKSFNGKRCTKKLYTKL